MAAAVGISSVTFCTAPLFVDARTISNPVRSGFHGWITRLRSPVRQLNRRPVKARPGSGSAASRCALVTTRSATRSRSMVVLPVPGGPLTPMRPGVESRPDAVITASCWFSASACAGLLGQRPPGTARGAVLASTWSNAFRTSIREAAGISAAGRR